MYIREVRQCGKNRVADIRHFFKAAKIPPIFRENRKKILPHRWEVTACHKAFFVSLPGTLNGCPSQGVIKRHQSYTGFCAGFLIDGGDISLQRSSGDIQPVGDYLQAVIGMHQQSDHLGFPGCQ